MIHRDPALATCFSSGPQWFGNVGALCCDGECPKIARFVAYGRVMTIEYVTAT